MTIANRLVFLVMLFGLAPAAQADWLHSQRNLMGTRITVELWHGDAARRQGCSERVFTEMRRIEALMSTYIASSEISRVNADAAISSLEISPELARLIEKSLYFSDISEGAFDITYASVGYAYDYRKKQQPDAETLQVFYSLKPGDRVRVEHEVKVGFRGWKATTEGTVVRTERRRHSLHFNRNFDDKVFSDTIVLRRDDGELTTVTLDEFSELTRISSGKTARDDSPARS